MQIISVVVLNFQLHNQLIIIEFYFALSVYINTWYNQYYLLQYDLMAKNMASETDKRFHHFDLVQFSSGCNRSIINKCADGSARIVISNACIIEFRSKQA